MEPRYIILMDFSTGELIKIKLTEAELKASGEFETFEEFLIHLKINMISESRTASL